MSSILIDSLSCDLIESSYTELICISPSKSNDVTTELQVVVDGVAAVCNDGNDCEITISDANTPHATLIDPATITTTTTLTITGTTFGTDSAAVEVTIGGVDCAVSDVTATSIECAVDGLPLG